MWTIDAQCSRCCKKDECEDRTKIIGTLSPLSNDLNAQAEHVNSPGDGVLIVACQDFAVV